MNWKMKKILNNLEVEMMINLAARMLIKWHINYVE